MDDWDAQKMLDKYIHDYMVRKNMHTAAETFANEANISTEPAAVNPPEGFLTEWWSLFWDVYSANLPNQPEATKDSSDKASSSVQRPDMNCMPPSVCPPLPTPGLPDFLQNVYSTTIPRPEMGIMLQSAVPTMIPRPDQLNSTGVGPPSVLDTTIGRGQPVTNWISENLSEQERMMLAARDLNFNAQLLNVDQVAGLPPFSINSRSLPKRVPQRPQRPVVIHGRSSAHTGSSSAAKAVPHEELKLKQPRSDHDDAGRGKGHEHVSSGGWPPSQDCISYSLQQGMGKQALTNLGSCDLFDDALHGRDFQSGQLGMSVDPLDGFVQSFFANEESPNDVSSSFCTSPGSSLSQREFQPKGK